VTLWQRTYGRTRTQLKDESLRPINAGSGRFGLATVLADTLGNSQAQVDRRLCQDSHAS
jgi:hypothetical protein